MREFSGLSFVERAHNVVLLGTPGVGKTHLAIALRMKAAEAVNSVLLLTLEQLMTLLTRARQENRLERALQQRLYPKVLIRDELGYLPLSREEASLFFRLLVRRYERASLIVTSNKGSLDWGKVFYDNVLAAAIFDRLLHHATTLNTRARATGRRRSGGPGSLARSPNPNPRRRPWRDDPLAIEAKKSPLPDAERNCHGPEEGISSFQLPGRPALTPRERELPLRDRGPCCSRPEGEVAATRARATPAARALMQNGGPGPYARIPRRGTSADATASAATSVRN